MDLERIGYLIAKYGDVTPKKNKSGVIYWSTRVNGEQVKSQSTKWTTFKQAKQDYYNYLESIDTPILDNSITFEEVVNEYLEYVKISNKLSSYIKDKSTINAHLMDRYRDVPIKNFDLKIIQKFQSDIQNKTFTRNGEQHLYKNRTLEIMQETFRQILAFAVKHRYLDINPFDLTTIVTRNTIEFKKKMTILSVDQFNKFVSSLDEQQDIAMYNILYWCGLRFGELMALDIKDYDRENKTLHIYKNYDPKNRIITTTKTNTERLVSVPDKCAIEIEKLLKEYSTLVNIETDGLILIGLSDRISQSKYSKSRMKQIKEVQISDPTFPYFTFHELRHSHVSLLLELGLTPFDISKRLGHSVEMVNETYGHLFPKKKEEILEKLNQL